MSQRSQEWILLTQRVVQWLALGLVAALAAAAALWSGAAMLGAAPWLRLEVGLGAESAVEAGWAIQLLLTALLLGLCFFLPTNMRVMRLEESHRSFKVSMWDVARAYQAVHAADREGVFELKSEFDSVRDRLHYLRDHPDFQRLEPELLELAAQMSHESRELADIYSSSRIERARRFLRQRREEADQFQARVQQAQAACRELRSQLVAVQAKEEGARAAFDRLRDELRSLAPEVGLELVEASSLPAGAARIAAE